MDIIDCKSAKEQGLARYFTGKPCKHGHIDERLVSNNTCCACNRLKVGKWQKDNPEKARRNQQNWQSRNPRLAALRSNDWYYDNIERHKKTRRRYFEENPHLRAKLSSLQRAAKSNRTPKWLTEDDFWLMDEIYRLAGARTAQTGVAWHVDHVIPLRGKLVSGLHVPSNLRVVEWKENLIKGNSYAVG